MFLIMKKPFLFVLLIMGLALGSCTRQVTKETPVSDYSGKLADEEIATGRLTAEILWKFGRISEDHLSPDGSAVLFDITRYNYKTDGKVTDIAVISSKGGEMKVLTQSDGVYHNLRWTPDGKKIGFLWSGTGTDQLWEMNPDGSGKTQVSNIDGGLIGFEYSPDASHILYLKEVKVGKDAHDVYPDLPLANVHIATDLMYRHWATWEDFFYSHIFVTDYGRGMITGGADIMMDEPWDSPLAPYFDQAEITWSPDGKYIAYTCKKMKGREYALSTNSDIYLYELADSSTENLTQGMQGYDKYPSFSPDSHKLAWQSMETPGNESDKDRLMIIDLDTREKQYLTENFDQSVEHLVWDHNNLGIYFLSVHHGTFQIYHVNTRSAEVQQITHGVHDYKSFSLGDGFLTGEQMSMSMATELFRVNLPDGHETQISFVNKNIYDHIKMGKVEERWVKTTDNQDMLVWVIYPPAFDPQKKYPALLYCQGGPQSAVSQFFSFRWNFQIMAAHDYIIVAPNRRGLPGFGQAWNAQISGDYGGQNMKDYLSAIDAVKVEPYVDADRLGAVGASYGGYSVFYLAGHHQKRFKAFIAHCGIYNFESMYTATEETFFVNHDIGGPYWETPKPLSYKYSPHLYVDKWDTPIMIITGENDFRIPYTQSLEAFDAAQLRGIPSKLLVFPDESHFVTKPQDAILWQREFFGWLDKYLK